LYPSTSLYYWSCWAFPLNWAKEEIKKIFDKKKQKKERKKKKND
jgi:hypothetical protein